MRLHALLTNSSVSKWGLLLLLQAVDPPLCEHLTTLGVNPTFYAIKWFGTLLTQTLVRVVLHPSAFPPVSKRALSALHSRRETCVVYFTEPEKPSRAEAVPLKPLVPVTRH